MKKVVYNKEMNAFQVYDRDGVLVITFPVRGSELVDNIRAACLAEEFMRALD